MADEIGGQQCPFCGEKKATFSETSMDIPHFGKVFIFSLSCDACKVRKADVEPAEQHEPVKYTIEVSTDDDLKARVVKSSHASIKIPHMITQESGPGSEGYVSNVEGVLNRIKVVIEQVGEGAEEKSDRKKAKNMLKKLNNVILGRDKLKLIIEDPTGNSAIIAGNAVKSKLK